LTISNYFRNFCLPVSFSRQNILCICAPSQSENFRHYSVPWSYIFWPQRRRTVVYVFRWDFLTKILRSFVMPLIGWGGCRREWDISVCFGVWIGEAIVRSPALMEMFIAVICGTVLRSAVIIHKAKRSNVCCCQGDKLGGADFIFLMSEYRIFTFYTFLKHLQWGEPVFFYFRWQTRHIRFMSVWECSVAYIKSILSRPRFSFQLEWTIFVLTWRIVLNLAVTLS
jgi:hypothetical protein